MSGVPGEQVEAEVLAVLAKVGTASVWSVAREMPKGWYRSSDSARHAVRDALARLEMDGKVMRAPSPQRGFRFQTKLFFRLRKAVAPVERPAGLRPGS